MFTGIIEARSAIVSEIEKGTSKKLEIVTPETWELKEGQSVAVNGACLTVVRIDQKMFEVELVEETLAKTAFKEHFPEEVNLERAIQATDRFEGHIVQGHVDTTGTVQDVQKQDTAKILTISYDETYDRLLVDKGSIAVDGVSLTAVNAQKGLFSVSLIPYTLFYTTLGVCREGSVVNLEFDIIGKYIMRDKMIEQ